MLKLKSDTIILLLISIIPSFIYVIFKLPSLTGGFLIALALSFVTILCVNRGSINLTNLIVIISILLSIILLGVISPYGGAWRFVGSYVILSLLLLSAAYTSNYLKKVSDHELKNSLLKVSRVLLLMGGSSFFLKINILGYESFSKSIFTFYEPSHFATVFGVILIPYLLMVEKYEKNLVITLSVLLALYLPSMTLLIYLLVFFLINTKNLLNYFLFALVFFFIFYLIQVFNPELYAYFLSRVVLSGNSSNLSALVYIQGWDEAYKVIQDGHFFGLGFQMSGSNLPSETAEKIYGIAGIYKNRDGPFIASKLIVDFGMIGIGIVCAYLFFLSKLYINFKKSISTKYKFAYGVLFGFSIEMFVRSNAYFTFGTFVIFTSIFLIVELRTFKIGVNKDSPPMQQT